MDACVCCDEAPRYRATTARSGTCIARPKLPRSLSRSDGASRDRATCRSRDNTSQVRRLPVVDAGGHLKGILSMNDIVLHADGAAGVNASAIVDALKGICAHKHVELV
jgi:hypothetical protein